ncbi:hypothetical protein SEUCBS139899_004649, partial [Sporothrix eucalyptigena]
MKLTNTDIQAWPSISTVSPVSRRPDTPVSDVCRTRPGQDIFAGIFPSPWHDDFYYGFNTEPLQDVEFDVDVGLAFLQPQTDISLDGSPSQTADGPAHVPAIFSRATPLPAGGTETAGSNPTAHANHNSSLPGHILAQHYSSELAKKYSFKSGEWTFYTYFFHRFTQSHPWVLCSIQAWTSTHLYYSGKITSLDGALLDYSCFVAHMKTYYGVSHEDF